MKKKLLSCLILLLTFSLPLKSQDDSVAYKHIGIGLGLNLTKTDLSETFKKPTNSFFLYLRFVNKKRFNSAVYLIVQKAVSENSMVKFFDQSNFKINSYAQANIQSLHFEGIIKLINLPKIQLSLSQGFGMMRYNVYDQFDNLLIDDLNSRQQGESYSGFSILLPSSISFNYQLKNDFGLQARVSLQNTMTDYLDNISAFGNPDNNDNILSFQLSCYKRIVF